MQAAASTQAVCDPGTCSYYSSTSYEVAGLVLAAVQKPDGDWTDLDFRAAITGDDSRYPSMHAFDILYVPCPGEPTIETAEPNPTSMLKKVSEKDSCKRLMASSFVLMICLTCFAMMFVNKASCIWPVQ